VADKIFLSSIMIELTEYPIDVPKLLEHVSHPAAGGVALFVGTARNHSHGKEVRWLEYETYLPMAVKTMTQIADEAATRWKLQAIAMVHRVGKVGIGEASIAIAVSSAHRNEAFEACRFAIDTLKKIVPIWKKEIYADGEVWVGLEGRPMTKGVQ
jgi:molybdopterin synthase catalytic subunit